MASEATDRAGLPGQPGTFARYSGATQRARILDAATRITAERGFAAVTVSDIVAQAGVSRSTFYEHFGGKTECVLEAYKAVTDIALSVVAGAVMEGDASDLEAAVTAGVRAYFELVRTETAAARLAFIEVRGLGAVGIEAEAAAELKYVELIGTLAEALGYDTASRALPLEALRLTLSGVDQRVAQELQAGDSGALERLEVATVAMVSLLAQDWERS